MQYSLRLNKALRAGHSFQRPCQLLARHKGGPSCHIGSLRVRSVRGGGGRGQEGSGLEPHTDSPCSRRAVCACISVVQSTAMAAAPPAPPTASPPFLNTVRAELPPRSTQARKHVPRAAAPGNSSEGAAVKSPQPRGGLTGWILGPPAPYPDNPARQLAQESWGHTDAVSEVWCTQRGQAVQGRRGAAHTNFGGGSAPGRIPLRLLGGRVGPATKGPFVVNIWVSVDVRGRFGQHLARIAHVS